MPLRTMIKSIQWKHRSALILPTRNVCWCKRSLRTNSATYHTRNNWSKHHTSTGTLLNFISNTMMPKFRRITTMQTIVKMSPSTHRSDFGPGGATSSHASLFKAWSCSLTCSTCVRISLCSCASGRFLLSNSTSSSRRRLVTSSSRRASSFSTCSSLLSSAARGDDALTVDVLSPPAEISRSGSDGPPRYVAASREPTLLSSTRAVYLASPG
mmetsp:Transcript_13782/g.34986  ORF Transcript_13782/g.34986 Transcript_13782/m.34986 type:complete len:212 (-) Transcript_13782:43-678(-)